MTAEDAGFELAQALDEMDVHLFQRIYLDRAMPTDVMIDNYVRMVGFRKYHHLKMLRDVLVRRLGRDAFDQHWQLERSHLPAKYGSFEDVYFERFEQPREAVVVVEEGANEFFDPGFPRELRHCFGNAKREAVKLYSASDAELFCDAGMFQIHGRNPESVFSTANPFSLTRHVRRVRARAMSGSVVFVGDIFNGANFCHFLFDQVTRIGHVIERGRIDPRALGSGAVNFVLSGVPGDFHRLVIGALSRVYTVDPGKFIFPSAPVCYQPSEAVKWFSDAYQHYQLPAQLMHPTSQAILRKISSAIDIPAGPNKRIYISRADAAMRRVANEGKLMDVLAPMGFKAVTLGSMPVTEQIAVIRGAEIIVAPHGMGLTHCAFHQGDLRLIELFNPGVGMDGYGALSRAFGFGYDYLIGAAVPGTLDFQVSPEALLDLLAQPSRLSGPRNLQS
jgi:hypothetical protein